MNIINANPYDLTIIGRQQTSGETDYIKGGALYRGANAASILVGSANDLLDLTDIYAPGTVAYTAGFKTLWQLSADGVWETI